ncbi:hypothetical protein SanaruYs_00830 [Chryseotalea sanaruensis]|uniref:Uncharacterized protein n=1 Tax=Chryseotalea sanaruensis TaxID=2482724 RepID=A0A401U4R8_9BACT|nr:hypothetical protein SanaruYs_00830 [Chryseotalea sanaruensis]
MLGRNQVWIKYESANQKGSAESYPTDKYGNSYDNGGGVNRRFHKKLKENRMQLELHQGEIKSFIIRSSFLVNTTHSPSIFLKP